MEIFLDYQELPSFHQGTVMTLGNFDGVHVGHRALLKELRTMANAHRTQTLVFTFDPHTQRQFKGITHYLTPNWYKLELLKSLGVDVILLQNFSPEFQDLTKDEFLQKVLKDTLAIRGIVIGPDIHFGKGGKGTKQAAADCT